MMTATERYGELIADLAAECRRLRKSEMVGICRTSATDETRLHGDKFEVIAISNTPRLRVHEDCLVNRLSGGSSFAAAGGLGMGRLSIWFWLGDFSFGAMNGKAEKLGAKRLLDVLGIGRIERILSSHPPVRPSGGIVLAANLV